MKPRRTYVLNNSVGCIFCVWVFFCLLPPFYPLPHTQTHKMWPYWPCFLCLGFSLHWAYQSEHDMASSPSQPRHQKCSQFGHIFGVWVLHYSFWAWKTLPKWLCLSSFIILSSSPSIWTRKLQLNWLSFLCLGFLILLPSCFLITRLSSSCTTYLMHYLVKYDLKHLKWLKITEIILIALDSVLHCYFGPSWWKPGCRHGNPTMSPHVARLLTPGDTIKRN